MKNNDERLRAIRSKAVEKRRSIRRRRAVLGSAAGAVALCLLLLIPALFPRKNTKTETMMLRSAPRAATADTVPQLKQAKQEGVPAQTGAAPETHEKLVSSGDERSKFKSTGKLSETKAAAVKVTLPGKKTRFLLFRNEADGLFSPGQKALHTEIRPADEKQVLPRADFYTSEQPLPLTKEKGHELPAELEGVTELKVSEMEDGSLRLSARYNKSYITAESSGFEARDLLYLLRHNILPFLPAAKGN